MGRRRWVIEPHLRSPRRHLGRLPGQLAWVAVPSRRPLRRRR